MGGTGAASPKSSASRRLTAASKRSPPTGGGSSFSGRDRQGRASEMKVLERWRVFENDPRYAAAFDEETVDLSRRIFGDITGGAMR